MNDKIRQSVLGLYWVLMKDGSFFDTIDQTPMIFRTKAKAKEMAKLLPKGFKAQRISLCGSWF
jgi:hypothetical protein